MSLFIVSIMNAILHTFNNIWNHNICRNTAVRKIMTGLAVALSTGLALIYLPTLCFIVALGKTIMYSHITDTVYTGRLRNGVDRKRDEIANGWLIYCFVVISYSLMNFMLGGIFLIAVQLLMLVAVADMSFLQDSEDTTLPIVMLKVVGKIANRYRTSKGALFLTGSFEYFGKVTYPSKRTAFYKYIMAYVSRKVYSNNVVKPESSIDMNKSMMDYESPRSSPKYPIQKPVLLIQSVSDTNDADKSMERMDNILSGILETLDKSDDSHNMSPQSVSTNVTSVTDSRATSTKSKKKSKKKIGSKSKIEKPDASLETNSYGKADDKADEGASRAEERDDNKEALREESHNEDHDADSNIFFRKQEASHEVDACHTASQQVYQNSDPENDQHVSNDDSSDDEYLYSKTLDLGSSHLFADSDRSLDEN